MNIRNAWGFLAFGLVMGFLPVVAPTWFPRSGMDGSSVRALWLELMGVVQTVIGATRVLGPMAMRVVVRWLEFAPRPVAPVLPFERVEAKPEFARAFDATSAREAA